MLTPCQRAAYKLIYTTYERTGKSPSLQELSDAVQLGGMSAAHACVRRLMERGYLRRERLHRGLVPLIPLQSRVFRFDDETKALVEVDIEPGKARANA